LNSAHTDTKGRPGQPKGGSPNIWGGSAPGVFLGSCHGSAKTGARPLMPKRKVTYRHYVAVVAVAGLTTMIVWASGAFSRAAPTPYNNQQLAQRLAVPAYINPADDPATWQQLVGSGAGTVGLVVANVDSGPGSAATAAWSGVLHNAHAAGMKVLGYVDTGYPRQPQHGGFGRPADAVGVLEHAGVARAGRGRRRPLVRVLRP